MESKPCKQCETVKPLSDFSHYTKDDKLYHRTECKACATKARRSDQKAYREANKETIAQKKKEYAQNNKEKINEYKTEYRNRPEVKERSKLKVMCACGCEIRKDGMRQHLKNYWHSNH